MPEIKVSKSYVRPDRTAVITCPYCKRQRELNVTAFKEHKSRFRIKCACQNVFVAQVEFRQRVRKKTNLRGSYINESQKKAAGKIIITNISVSGLEFTSVDAQNFKAGDELTLQFTLDDDHRTEIIREAVVRSVRNKMSVGCEFTETGNIALDGPLGTYMAKI